jgi:hypothetical protein
LSTALVLLPSRAAFADVSSSPSNTGLPGANLFQQAMDNAQWIAMVLSVAVIAAGGGVWGWSHVHSSYGGANVGKKMAMGGFTGAILAGLAVPAVNLLYHTAAGG